MTTPNPDVDLLDLCCWLADGYDFHLARQDGHSRSRSGKIWSREVISPLWMASYESAPLDFVRFRQLRARLDAIQRVGGSFVARDMTRLYPAAYPGGFSFPNLLVNPGLETGDLTGWISAAGVSVISTPANVRSGTYAAQLDTGSTGAGSGTQRYLYSDPTGFVPVVENQFYDFRAWLKTDVATAPSGTTGIGAIVQWYAADKTTLLASGSYQYFPVTTSFGSCVTTRQAPAGAAWGRCYVTMTPTAPGRYTWIDDLSLKPAGDGFNGDAQISQIGDPGLSIQLNGLPAGFKLTAGDLFSYSWNGVRVMHEIAETISANASGATADFEIDPPLWPGVAVGKTINLRRPGCQMKIVPGSVDTSYPAGGALGSIAFQAYQSPMG